MEDGGEVVKEKLEIDGWDILISSGPGCLGPRTTTAIASQGEVSISAVADDEDTSLKMLRDMIRKRAPRSPA